MTRGNGKKAWATTKKRYTPEQIRQQKAAGGKASSAGGFAWLKKNDPERFKQIIAERDAKRKAKQ